MDELNFHESDSRRKRLEEGRSNDSCWHYNNKGNSNHV
jgi:hypothetical protein